MAGIIVKKQGEGAVTIKEIDSLFNINANGVDIVINKNNGRLIEMKNTKGIIPFNNGPVLQEAENNFQNFKHRFDGRNLVIEERERLYRWPFRSPQAHPCLQRKTYHHAAKRKDQRSSSHRRD